MPSAHDPSRSQPHPLEKDAEDLLSVRDEVMRKRHRVSVLADAVGRTLSHPVFFVSLVGAHALWVALNLAVWPWTPWDPYPFMFLATVASAEAPFIALLVLMHQKREAHIDELREELDLHVSLFLEREVTVVLRMLKQLHEKLGISTAEDPGTLAHLEERLHPDRLLDHLRQRLEQAERGDVTLP